MGTDNECVIVPASNMPMNNYFKYQIYAPTDKKADDLGYVHFKSMRKYQQYMYKLVTAGEWKSL